jgi:hypothetical protein
MKFKSIIAALAALGIAVSAAHAGSTVNPNVPALRDPLNSPPIQQNFQATFNDINNILGKFASNTAPTNPTAFQEWANTTTSPVVVFNYWNAGTATWIPFATLNIATGVYSNFATSAGFLATAPITVSVSGGVATYGLAKDSNFATVGGALAFAPIADGSLLARCISGAGEPTACTWPTFAAQAIGATNGIFPHFVGGVWATDTTGTSGHAVPFLDGANTFAAIQTIYPGTATLRTALAGTILRTAQLDGTASVHQQDSFGAAGAFSCMRSDGTAAASTALTTSDLICAYGAHGFDGTANSTVAAALRLYAAQPWTSSAHGTYARISTTADGSTSIVDQFGVENDGGVTVPPTVTGGSKGPGTINVSGGYDINGAPFGVSNLAGTGTGVQTALGANTGTAGAFVVNGGALGAPSSGTLTNATGLPISGITGLGTGVPALLAGASTGTGSPVGGTAPTISGPTFSGTILGTYTLGGTPTIASPTITGSFTATGLVTLGDLTTGTQDTILGYFGSTSVSAIAPGNCANALTYSTSTHAFGCNTTAGTGTVTTTGTPTAGQNAYFTAPTVIQGATPASVQTGSLSPAGAASTTGVMAGLGRTGCSITPSATGRVHFEIAGTASNTTITAVNSTIRFGTGTAPANAGAPAGTQIGAIYSGNPVAATDVFPITMVGIATGLTLGTAVWFDADLFSPTGSPSIVVACNAFEY